MPLKDETREAIVDALDALGERNRLSYEERTSWDEPYPPSFVAKRREALRRDQGWTKRLIFGLIILAGMAAWLGMELGWRSSVFAYGIPLLLIPQLPTISRLIRETKAEQLYTLLHRLEGEPSVEPDVTPLEPA